MFQGVCQGKIPAPGMSYQQRSVDLELLESEVNQPSLRDGRTPLCSGPLAVTVSGSVENNGLTILGDCFQDCGREMEKRTVIPMKKHHWPASSSNDAV